LLRLWQAARLMMANCGCDGFGDGRHVENIPVGWGDKKTGTSLVPAVYDEKSPADRNVCPAVTNRG
jgi:hypothetical protein